MSRISQFSAIWISFVLIAFYLLVYFQFGYTPSKFGADWLALVGLSFMSASMTPAAYNAFRRGIFLDTDRFIFSYWLFVTIIMLHRVWVIFLALTKGDDIVSPYYWTPISGLLALGLALASGFGALAPFSGETPLPKRDMLIFGIAAGFSGIVAGIAIGVFLVTDWTNF